MVSLVPASGLAPVVPGAVVFGAPAAGAAAGAGAWQAARSLGAWTLAGATVAPGFDFAGFEIAPEGWEP